MKPKDAHFTFIVALALAALVLLGLFFLVERTESFQIQDKCGNFVNLFSHSINDKGQCRTRCEQQCETKEMRYKGMDFKEVPRSCNECQCRCGSFTW